MSRKSYELQDLWVARVGDVVHDVLTGLNGVVTSFTEDSCYMVINIRNKLLSNEPIGTGFLRVPFIHRDVSSSTGISRVVWLPKLDDFLDIIDKSHHSDFFERLKELSSNSYEGYQYDSLEHFALIYVLGLDQWNINGKLCNRVPLKWIENEWVEVPAEVDNG